MLQRKCACACVRVSVAILIRRVLGNRDVIARSAMSSMEQQPLDIIHRESNGRELGGDPPSSPADSVDLQAIEDRLRYLENCSLAKRGRVELVDKELTNFVLTLGDIGIFLMKHAQPHGPPPPPSPPPGDPPSPSLGDPPPSTSSSPPPNDHEAIAEPTMMTRPQTRHE